MLRKFRRAVSPILLLISLVLIVWAALPNPRQSIIQPVSYAETQIPFSIQGSTSTMMEPRQVILEWPKSMRIGETDEIILKFEPVISETGPSNLTVSTFDIYNRYNIMAEARFEVAGIGVIPANPTRESMPAGQTISFKWEIGNDQEGSYIGKVWLSLRLLPLDGGKASQVPVYIQEIKIRTSSLFGLNESITFLLGGVGIVFAAALVYDDLIAWVRKWIKKN
jgi:hypothetical protein